MKRFRFRLHTVLAARGRARDAARGRLADVLAALADAQIRLDAARRDAGAGRADLAAATGAGRVDVDGWLDRRRHAAALAAAVAAAGRRVAECESAVAAARVAAVEADRGVKALETLETRDRAAHAAAALAAEQRAAEDVWNAARVAGRAAGPAG